MSTAELIYEKTKKLPASLQSEALDFVDFLISRQTMGSQDRDWPRLSASEMARQYGPGDEVYDQD